MSDIFRGPLIFRIWRRDPNSIAAQSQWFLETSFPPFIPAAVVVDADHFPRGPLFARVEARRSIVSQDFTDPSNLALLTAPAPLIMPVPQGDWPNPRGRGGLRPQDFIDPTNFALLTPAPLIMPVPQGDWPNPRGRPPLNLSLADSFKLPLQQVLPPHLTDWPNPQRPLPARFDWIQPKTQEAVVTEVVNPGFNEWAVPDGARRGRQDWIAPSNVALLTPPAVQMPLNQYDWPLPPRAPQRAVTLLTHTDSFKLPLQQDLPAGEREQILPVRAVLARPDWQRYTLPWAQAPPLRQNDWPNPRGPLPTHLRTWTDSFKLPLQQTLPPNQYDWPTPLLRTVQRQDWQQSTSVALSSTVPQILPPRQLNWPNPRGPVRASQDWILPQPYVLNVVTEVTDPAINYLGNPFQILRSVNFLTWTQPKTQEAAVAAANPFVQTDWPVPRGRVPLNLSFADWFKLSLQQTLPSNQYNWPNPVLRTVQRQDWLQSTSIALSTAVAPPFFETEWPNPTLRTVQRRDFSDSFKLPLQQVLPPHQTDWPNPRGPLPARFDWIQPQPYVLNAVAEIVNPGFNEWAVPSGPLSRLRPDWIFPQPYTLNVVVAADPVRPIDWPNPRGPALRQTSFTDSFKLPLQQTLPPHQTDWPNPVLRTVQRQDWQQSTPLALSSAVQPFAQNDWPNPRAARPVVRDWTDSFKLPLQQTMPPRQLDWPNPGRRKPPVVADWIQVTTAAQKFIQSPFNQFDWPNPTRRKISLLPTWTDSFKLPLQQIMPPRQLDWPVPKGPRQPVITTRYFMGPIRPTPPIPPVYDADNTLKNEIRRMRYLDNATGRIRYLKNEVRR